MPHAPMQIVHKTRLPTIAWLKGTRASCRSLKAGIAYQNVPIHPKTANTPANASVVRQTERRLFRVRRARFTFSRMSPALAVQMNGFGLSLWRSM